MLKIHGQDIFISRGETATLSVTPMEGDSPYAMTENDYLIMELWPYGKRCAGTALRKQSAPGSTVFVFAQRDTARLSGTYAYSVRLVYADGSATELIGETETKIPKVRVMR